VTSRTRLPVGLRVKASLDVGRHRFEGLRAVVLGAEPQPDGHVRMHLAFRDMDPAERERMVAAVTRLELEARADSRLQV
jgi:hypothetical protein